MYFINRWNVWIRNKDGFIIQTFWSILLSGGFIYKSGLENIHRRLKAGTNTLLNLFKILVSIVKTVNPDDIYQDQDVEISWFWIWICDSDSKFNWCSKGCVWIHFSALRGEWRCRCIAVLRYLSVLTKKMRKFLLRHQTNFPVSVSLVFFTRGRPSNEPKTLPSTPIYLSSSCFK